MGNYVTREKSLKLIISLKVICGEVLNNTISMHSTMKGNFTEQMSCTASNKIMTKQYNASIN
jgi:hypothetical protein